MTNTIPLAPITSGDRIQALDSIRGFALLGILLMNIEGMVGPLMASISGVDPLLTGADRWVDTAIYLLVQGKFFPLFSMLFGMGFAIMLARAQAAGRPFVAVYLRRVLALLAIGLAHALLVWSGDILVTYALMGLVMLLFFRGTPQSRLPKWGVALMLLPVGFTLLMGLIGTAVQAMPEEARAGFEKVGLEVRTRTPKEFAAQIRQERETWAPVVRRSVATSTPPIIAPPSSSAPANVRRDR